MAVAELRRSFGSDLYLLDSFRVVKSGEQALVSLSAGEPDKEPSLFPFTSDTDSFSCLSSESFEDPSTMAVAAQYLFPHSRKQCADLPGNVPSPSAAKQLIEAARAVSLSVLNLEFNL